MLTATRSPQEGETDEATLPAGPDVCPTLVGSKNSRCHRMRAVSDGYHAESPGFRPTWHARPHRSTPWPKPPASRANTGRDRVLPVFETTVDDIHELRVSGGITRAQPNHGAVKHADGSRRLLVEFGGDCRRATSSEPRLDPRSGRSEDSPPSGTFCCRH